MKKMPKALSKSYTMQELIELKFYSVVTRKKIEIPKSKIKLKKKNGRYFAVGEYMAKDKKTGKKKKYFAWRVLSKDQAMKMKQFYKHLAS